MAFFGLMVIGCSFLVGCQTISPEVLAERNHRIKEINAKLFRQYANTFVLRQAGEY